MKQSLVRKLEQARPLVDQIVTLDVVWNEGADFNRNVFLETMKSLKSRKE